jgi:hypothetical protein
MIPREIRVERWPERTTFVQSRARLGALTATLRNGKKALLRMYERIVDAGT